MLFAGTSGFSYPTWKGKFYPATLAGSKMLGFYGERLNGVELNGSFYRTPPESTLLNWAVHTPPGFRFCMKANRGLTYSAAAFDKVGPARIFTERIAILGDRLGPVLLQFTPTRQRNVGSLDSLLGAQVAEKEAPRRVDAEIDQTQDAARQSRFQPLVEGKQRAKDEKAQHHLVRDLWVDDLAGLPEGVLVDVLDAPGKICRRAVVLAVDDVPDAADREPDHRAGAAGVDDLPERELRPARPDVGAHHCPEEPAPLADAALRESEHAQQVAREDSEVLPHV